MCFLLNLSYCVKSYGHFCQILALYDAHSLNMVMPRDPRCKFRKIFYFVLILYLILGKVTKFPVEKLSTSEVISQKPHGDMENTPRAFRINGNWRLLARAVLTLFDMMAMMAPKMFLTTVPKRLGGES